MHDVLTALDNMKARWMTGGSAQAAAPADWHDAAQGETPDLTLLVLAAQFQSLATLSMPPDMADTVPLPKLTLPTLEGEARALFRRVAHQKGWQPGPTLALMQARGVTAHPFDWFPKASDDIPAVYAPWRDWREAAPTTDPNEALTLETWDLWSPFARRVELEAMRSGNPDAARALIEGLFPSLAADQRHRLLTVLQDNLSEADLPFLEDLETDRSGKVRTLAAEYRARLGHLTADPEDQAELAAFFTAERRGLIKRTNVVSANKLKSAAQERRRAELMAALPLAALAEGLGLSPDALIAQWTHGDATDGFSRMVAATGTEAQVEAYVTGLIAVGAGLDALPALFARLSAKTRLDLAPKVLSSAAHDLGTLAACLRDMPGCLSIDVLQQAPRVQSLLGVARNRQSDIAQALDFHDLGFLADQTAAQALLDQFVDAGMLAADPSLALLRLNAALAESPAP